MGLGPDSVSGVAEVAVVNSCGFAMAGALLLMIQRRARDPVSFAHVFSVVWAFALVVAQNPPVGETAPRTTTLLILFAAWWAFLVGGLVPLSNSKPFDDTPVKASIDRTWAAAIMWLLIGVHVYTWTLEMPSFERFDITSFADLAGAMGRLRVENVLLVKIPWYLHFVRSGFCYYIPLAFLLRREKAIRWRTVAAVLAIALVTSLGRFTRAPVLWVCILAFICWHEVFKPRIWRFFCVGAVGAIVFSVMFIGMQAVLAPDVARYSGAYVLVDNYWGGPIRAYEAMLSGEYPRFEGNSYTLNMVNEALWRVGVLADYPELVRHWWNNKNNIYTFLDAFTLDGGVPFALVGAFLTGLGVGWVYSQTRHHGGYLRLTMYATCAYFCAMTTANNEFIRTTILLMLAVAVPINSLISRKTRESSSQLRTGGTVPRYPLPTLRQPAAETGRFPHATLGGVWEG